MKLAEHKSVTLTRGVQRRTQMTISPNAKSFRALVDGIYPQKIKAPIRELSTNAIDAHIDAGTLDRKFVVILPTIADPTFTVRDYGTGMSQEKIETLYSKLFESDKDMSNEATGCFGIGSKSPFAYVSSFFVTSYYHGVKYMNVVSSADGIPEVQFFGSEPTTEHDGLEVGFAVEPTDITKFHNEAKSVYKYFAIKPEIRNADFEFEAVTKDLIGNGWYITSSEGEEKSMAIMGSIGYPIDAMRFVDDTSNIHPNAPERYRSWDKHTWSAYQKLLDIGLHIEFSLGELEMTPSREELQYTNAVVDTIKARLDAVRDELSQLISDRFKNAPNLYEARKEYTRMTGKLGTIMGMSNLINVSYKGVKLTDTIQLKSYYPAKDNIPGTMIVGLSKNAYRGKVYTDKRVDNISLCVAEQASYVEQDTPRGAQAAVRRYISSGKTARAFMVKFDDDAARDTFCEVMGFDSSYLTKASSLPKPVRIPGAKGSVSNEKVFVLDVSQTHYERRDCWLAEEIDMEDGGVFVEINRYEAYLNAGLGMSPNSLKDIVDKFKDGLGIKLEPIVGVKTSVAKKFREYEDAEWVDLKAYLSSELESYIVKSHLMATIEDIQTISQFAEATYYLDMNKNSTEKPKVGSDFEVFITKLVNLDDTRKKMKKKVENVLDIASTIGYNVESAKAVDLSGESDALKAKYPILNLLDRYDAYDSEKSTIVINYINKEN